MRWSSEVAIRAKPIADITSIHKPAWIKKAGMANLFCPNRGTGIIVRIQDLLINHQLPDDFSMCQHFLDFSLDG